MRQQYEPQQLLYACKGSTLYLPSWMAASCTRLLKTTNGSWKTGSGVHLGMGLRVGAA